MFAMLLGLALSIPAMIFAIFCQMITLAVVSLVAYKNHMSVLWWFIGTAVLFSWVIIPFVFILIRIRTRKCPDCGASTKNNTGICPNCNTQVKRVDDKKFIQRILLIRGVIIAAIFILEMIVPFFIN